jgi:hypothetical protein
MTKRRETTKAELAAEIDKLDLRPKREADARTEEVLRRMLNTPPDPFTPSVKSKKRAGK